MNTSLKRHAAEADVCLLLEGTFPFVRGGVSSWVNDMIRAYPDTRFGIVFIGSREEDYPTAVYALPENVVHFEAHYLYEDAPADAEPRRARHGDRNAFAYSSKFHELLRDGRHHAEVGAMMIDLIGMLTDGGALSEEQFLYSREAWDYIEEQYSKRCTDPSFTDYFWTVRNMHKPIWQLARVAERTLRAKVYHTVSTGYAGYLGALLHYRTGRPLIVSEHGIYTKERKIDLLQSRWIRDNRGLFERDVSDVSYFRELWVRFFEALGRFAYDAASEIVALYEGNRLRQVADGARAELTRTIPNGIDVDGLRPLLARRDPARPRRVVALIGRVVPIKDIKTFIRAIFVATRTLPDIEGWIVGPEEEDRDYAHECHALAESLGLERNLKFFGFQRIADVMPQVDLVALSSISEALPLVVLEGFAAGVPAVTTDVGACRELIEGALPEDRALGVAGAVVPIANPAAFAEAAISLLTDTARWDAAQRAGLARAQRYYTRPQMIDRYRGIYERAAAQPDAAPRESRGGDGGAPGCPMHAANAGAMASTAPSGVRPTTQPATTFGALRDVLTRRR
ncbi:MAG TPA: GT4 family glycosyltransferase PelF [Trinickia sp.]|uniref:GT4 family glycosyltransferase PelF n=1 Tax=Trinickia sp. TaxID=2571163 RepID=UPI002CCE803F|nr:GT4 family glycosyltransferase PelF [Trinickia sp.]HVW48802.1 GT4 family glycosyltransferase PelF [Trinickia sp.]